MIYLASFSAKTHKQRAFGTSMSGAHISCIDPGPSAGARAQILSGAHREQVRKHRGATPNPSLKRSANGRPPDPVWRYAVHFRQPGPGALPLSPA
jgi:hypothetical protein